VTGVFASGEGLARWTLLGILPIAPRQSRPAGKEIRMQPMTLLALSLTVGLTAGGVAGLILKRYGLRFLPNLAVGLIGAIIGGVVFSYFLNVHIDKLGAKLIVGIIDRTLAIQIDGAIVVAIVNATLGAVLLLIVHWMVERT
jgi:uncharacterized membrane protein YeaQ/YmgE (transglycosylase-associated protein family)